MKSREIRKCQLSKTNLNYYKQSINKNEFYPKSAPRENGIKLLVTTQRVKILTF